MHVTPTDANGRWLLLIFSLPRSRASQRVEVWRKLRRYGAMALPSSGYVLPANAANREKLEWLAGAIRSYKGQASVVAAASFDDLPNEKLAGMFNRARAADYESLSRDLKKFLAFPPARRPAGRLARLRRRFQEIAAIDFFSHPAGPRIEALLARADRDGSDGDQRRPRGREFSHRTWLTRHRPGIDRVSSAWLIRRFIDPRAKFVFGGEPGDHPQAIPFDMYGGTGFGHRGDDCTFETLMKRFAVRDRGVKRIAEIVHDADLGDSKFGRPEGAGLDRVLNGWAKQDISDDELLRRGVELIEGLYDALS